MTDEFVQFDSDGSALSGTLTPATDPVAAAVVLAGSGRIDRDSNHRRLPLAVTGTMARALSAAGVTTLRYDKAGVGASTGDYLSIGFHQRCAEANAAVSWLLARVPRLPVLVVGHSEGGLHAIELAAAGAVAGAVLLGTPARPGQDVLAWQTAALLGTLPGWLVTALRLANLDVLRMQRTRLARIVQSPKDVLRVQGVRTNARWMREFAGYDPRPDLARITVPVLAITGGHDVQVPPSDVDVMRNLVRGPFEGHVAADLSHALRPDPDTRGPLGYRRQLRHPVDPAVVALVSNWITTRWGGRARTGTAKS